MEEEKKKSIKNKLKEKFIEGCKILATLAGCALVGMWLAVGLRAGSPLRYAQRYFKYYASSNYSAMYDMVSCKEDDFINEDHFTYKYETEKLYGGIKKYEFNAGKKKNGIITYEVTYTTGNDKKGTFEISVEKQAKRVYGIFNTWKVNLDNEIAKDCSLAVPGNLTGYIDHISLDSIRSSSTEDGSLKYYFVDRMFKGDHIITLNQDNITAYTFSEPFDNAGTQVVINANKLALPEDDEKDMYTYSKFLLGSMYGYAMDGKTQFEDFSYMFDSNENTQSLAKACFDNLRSATVKDDGALLETLNITNVSVALASYTYPSDALVDVAYTYSYVAKTGRTTIDGVTKEYDGMGTAMAMMRFKKINGTWKVTDISMPCADYSKK